jgi:hypothetical protein
MIGKSNRKLPSALGVIANWLARLWSEFLVSWNDRLATRNSSLRSPLTQRLGGTILPRDATLMKTRSRFNSPLLIVVVVILIGVMLLWMRKDNPTGTLRVSTSRPFNGEDSPGPQFFTLKSRDRSWCRAFG